MSNPFANRSIEELIEFERAATRLVKIEDARENLIDFVQLMMPDPEDEENPERSAYKVAPHHRLLAEALERVARGECLRLAISMPPQHGKSELASRMFPSWFMGKFPRKNLMFATYNETFAKDFGGDVQDIMRRPQYRAVFPETAIRKGSDAKDFMVTTHGGKMVFIGRGGSGTGKPADLVVIDDPLKNEEEAESPTIRERLHGWYSKVIYSRVRTTTAIIVIQTRWHEDDLIGRLCDIENENCDPEEARHWDYINIPAVLQDDDVTRALGREPGEALWPDEFSLAHLKSAERLNPRTFQALYQGRPTPDDGYYFTKEMIVEYDAHELPKRLNIYGASDHAVTEKQDNDPNCLGCVGVDENDDIWLLPDLVWQHMETDRVVEEMLDQMRRNKPLVWWAENDVIRKAIGPFLRKRMHEERIYTLIDPKTPSTDKRVRARSIQGRMSMRKVRFPRFAPWWPNARAQLLKFPYAAHDDFVDFMAWIGLGLTQELRAEKPRERDNVVTPEVGTLAWIKWAANQDRRAEARRKAAGGF